MFNYNIFAAPIWNKEVYLVKRAASCVVNIFIKHTIIILLLLTVISCGNSNDNLRIKNGEAIENISTDEIITGVISYSFNSSIVENTLVMSNIQPGEVRHLKDIPSETLKNGSVKIKAAYRNSYTNNSSGSFFNILPVILTGVVALIVSICIYLYRNYHKGRHEIKILINEMEDLKRHLEANKKWIERIEIGPDKFPLQFYLERFCSWSDLIMNSSETYRSIPSSCSKSLAHTRLHLRNMNIEIHSLIECMNTGLSCDIIDQHWRFIKDKNVFLINWFDCIIKYMRNDIKLSFYKSKINKMYENQVKELAAKQPVYVIYK